MFRMKYLIAFLGLVIIPAFAQQEPAEVVLPLKFNTGTPNPYGFASTTIYVQGKRLPVIIDTGANQYGLVLSKKALQRIQIKVTGQQICSTAINGKHCEAEFIAPQVQIGTFQLKNVEGQVLTKLWGTGGRGFKKTKASEDGLLGMRFLSKFNVLLDYPHKRMILVNPISRPIEYDIKNWIAIPYTGHLLTQLKFNGKPITLSWDTGAVPSVIRKTYATPFSVLPCPSKAPYAKLNCNSIMSTSFTTEGGQKLPGIWFKLMDNLPERRIAPFDGLVGTNFYANNLVYFDFSHHKIYIGQ